VLASVRELSPQVGLVEQVVLRFFAGDPNARNVKRSSCCGARVRILDARAYRSAFSLSASSASALRSILTRNASAPGLKPWTGRLNRSTFANAWECFSSRLSARGMLLRVEHRAILRDAHGERFDLLAADGLVTRILRSRRQCAHVPACR
jgi:hypothetical protein